MSSGYHSGELSVQTRAGVSEQARRVGGIINSTIPPVAGDFLREQRMLISSTVDSSGWVWASLLTGAPGFACAIDERTVRIVLGGAASDRLWDDLHEGARVGILAIDLASRRRMRINGTLRFKIGGAIYLGTEQVYSNCPKYIQARELVEPTLPAPGKRSSRRGTALSEDQQTWIEGADTFFIASHHPAGGADASHRGGNPGFVRIRDGRTLLWPDYQGNNMFNTLGNIAENPNAGLLFVDFERGGTLQLTGRAAIHWDRQRAAAIPGAERLLGFQVAEVIEVVDAVSTRWRFLSASPFNPS